MLYSKVTILFCFCLCLMSLPRFALFSISQICSGLWQGYLKGQLKTAMSHDLILAGWRLQPPHSQARPTLSSLTLHFTACTPPSRPQVRWRLLLKISKPLIQRIFLYKVLHFRFADRNSLENLQELPHARARTCRESFHLANSDVTVRGTCGGLAGATGELVISGIRALRRVGQTARGSRQLEHSSLSSPKTHCDKPHSCVWSGLAAWPLSGVKLHLPVASLSASLLMEKTQYTKFGNIFSVWAEEALRSADPDIHCAALLLVLN